MRFGCLKFTFDCPCDSSKLSILSSPYLIKTRKITRKELKFRPKCSAGVMILHENALDCLAPMEYTNAKEDTKDRLERSVPQHGKLVETGEFLTQV